MEWGWTVRAREKRNGRGTGLLSGDFRTCGRHCVSLLIILGLASFHNQDSHSGAETPDDGGIFIAPNDGPFNHRYVP